MKKSPITVEKKRDNWTIGHIGECSFEIKLASKPSAFGINEGRIIKLWIGRDGSEIAHYERGWDRLPATQDEVDLTQALIDTFDPEHSIPA